ncbi:hypothetical protein [Mycobacterium sp. SA01]|uniref:hypothetical protein n=1 Tax=Mycobacterium sp. SA01 TaxID=3238820 RepID=UPI00351AD5BF
MIDELDGIRTAADDELGRHVIADDLGSIEVHVDEIDHLCSMPLRIAHNDAAGFVLEVGPFDLGGREVDRLREAIRQFDAINAGVE